MTTAVADPALLACELAVLRALEIAAKRMRSTGRRRAVNSALHGGDGIPPERWYLALPACARERLDHVLGGAWDQLRTVLAADPDRDRLIAACDQYARALLASRQPHARPSLARFLAVARDPN